MWATKAIIQGLLCLAGEAVEMTRVDTPTDGTGSSGSLALPPTPALPQLPSHTPQERKTQEVGVAVSMDTISIVTMRGEEGGKGRYREVTL